MATFFWVPRCRVVRLVDFWREVPRFVFRVFPVVTFFLLAGDFRFLFVVPASSPLSDLGLASLYTPYPTAITPTLATPALTGFFFTQPVKPVSSSGGGVGGVFVSISASAWNLLAVCCIA